MINDLKLKFLQNCRKEARLTMLYKINNDFVALERQIYLVQKMYHQYISPETLPSKYLTPQQSTDNIPISHAPSGTATLYHQTSCQLTQLKKPSRLN